MIVEIRRTVLEVFLAIWQIWWGIDSVDELFEGCGDVGKIFDDFVGEDLNFEKKNWDR